MASNTEVQESVESFAQSCNEHAQLGGMIKDWNRVFHIHATDTGEEVTLVTQNGHVSASAGAPENPSMKVQSTAEILGQIFYGEVSPNEPYNDGSLRLIGPEEDIVRLDFVIAMLWE